MRHALLKLSRIDELPGERCICFEVSQDDGEATGIMVRIPDTLDLDEADAVAVAQARVLTAMEEAYFRVHAEDVARIPAELSAARH